MKKEEKGKTIVKEVNLVGVETYPEKRTAYFFVKKQDFRKGDWCTYKLREGVGIGQVKFTVLTRQETPPGYTRYLNRATLEDKLEFERRMKLEKKAFEVALDKISHSHLPMRLVSTKYPLGIDRITFYYTAKQRVDFRTLVKDLAAIFKMRIQMRQIGARDEPQVLTESFGICGRRICCASFLGNMKRRLDSVSLEAARLQNLPLASSKISGICGRLRCCLNFEYTTYCELKKDLPQVGEVIGWQGEKMEIVSQNLLTETVTAQTKNGTRKVLTKDQLNKLK